MADSVLAPTSAATAIAVPRHSALVRVTHWVTTVAFLALLVTGVEILISHTRFYWGETGNVNAAPLFRIPIPASRPTVPTGYGYVLPDQNGWSRYLHFQSAWAAVLTGLVYVVFGFISGHFRRNLIEPGEVAYNPIQRLTYLLVVFILFPMVIWTGLAMSPAIASAFPWSVTMLGGQQSARTLHFFDTVLLVLFLLVHVVKVYFAGFRKRVGAMIVGGR